MRKILILALMASVALVACGGNTAGDQAETQAAQTEKAVEQEKAATKAADTETKKAEAKVDENPIVARSMKKDPGPETEYVVMNTSMGAITFRMFPKQAPLAVSNFKGLAAKGFYDGIIFHRCIDGFMVQGGDPTGTGRGGESLWGGTFADEFDPSLTFNRAGLLAMANRGPSTNSSQFFITQVPTTHLTRKHTIFGEVVEGMDVVNAIAKVEKGAMDKPVKDVTIDSIQIEDRQEK